MEAVDLLCSRNAHYQNVLVRRAHSRIHQVAPIEANEQAWKDQLYLVGRAQWKVNQPPSLREREQAWKGRGG